MKSAYKTPPEIRNALYKYAAPSASVDAEERTVKVISLSKLFHF
jgi:hypothetical protein